MNRMIVKFDERKAEADNVDIQTLMTKTENVCKKRNIGKNSAEEYVGKDEYDFMVVIGALHRMEWFMKYVEQWLWYENSKYPIDLITRLAMPEW